MINLDELERVAQEVSLVTYLWPKDKLFTREQVARNTFHTAAGPTTVLALIARVRKLETQLSEVHHEAEYWQNDRMELQRLDDAKIAELSQSIDEAQERERVLVEALNTIRIYYGRVCGEFGSCTHVGCQSAYGAWATADNALREVGALEEVSGGN